MQNDADMQNHGEKKQKANRKQTESLVLPQATQLLTSDQDPYWQKWLEWCRAHGVVVDKQVGTSIVTVNVLDYND